MTATISAGFAIWLVLVSVVLLLAMSRLVMPWGKYTVLHVRRSEMSMIPAQVREHHRLNRIDFWGQLLTASAFILGLLLIGLWMLALRTDTTGQVGP